MGGVTPLRLLFLFYFFHVFHVSQFFFFSVFFHEKCVSFFFFFSFYMPLLAFVSGFNKRCFFRSRCSMEMWCLDDMGQDSWDWVEPPAWERACFNSPEWSGGSSRKRTGASSNCIIVVVDSHVDVQVDRDVCGCSDFL